MSIDVANHPESVGSNDLVPERGSVESGPKSTARTNRSWGYALGLVLTIGVAGVVIYLNLPEHPFETETPTITKATPVAKTPAASANERGMVASRIALLHLGEGAARKDLVALAKPTGPTRFDEILRIDPGILLRELIRQSLLMAARDEMGLSTRDEVLDDATPAKSEGGEVEVAFVFRNDGPSRIVVRRGNDAAAEPILEHTIGPVPNEVGIIAMVLPVAEGLSRTGFPEALKKLGLAGQPNRWKAEGPLPPKVEKQLEGLSLFDHFEVVRDLHDVIRNEGESPERLGALARAYAQLGVLTEFQWHPAHKVYKARALLYAQRLLAREPGSVWALRNRAFVRSVVGLHQEALDDLAEVSKRAGKTSVTKPPAWVEPIEAYARNDLAHLGQMDGPYLKLARLLRMLAVEYPLGTDHSLKAAQEVVTLDEECFRAHDAMCRVGGVGNLHIATTMGPEILTKLLPIKLGAIDALPTGVKLALERGAGELSFVEALDKAGRPENDQGEPSWGALAHLIRETRFIQINRRLVFMKQVWSVPVDDYWADARPFVAGHRYVTFLDGYAFPPQEMREPFVAFTNKIDLNELESHEPELFSATDKYQTTRGKGHDASFAMGHGDAVARDLASSVQTPEPKYKTLQARVLLAVSPNSTLAQSILVTHAWDEFKDRAQAWEEKGADSPLLLDSLAWRYRELKQLDRAKTLLRRCLAISPQHLVYKQLADIYKQEGDMEGWRKTLEDYLANGEDKGLDHAATRVEIARYYMDQKRWKEATPYAEAAAETWAAWAILCAIECHEATGEWEQGEAWAQRVTERYPSDCWPRWYCFCKRTGHGDIESAKAWTEAYIEASQGRPDLADPTVVGYYYWLSGSTKRAFDSFNTLYKAKLNVTIGICLMLVADEVGDKKRRDEVLNEVCSRMKDQAPKTVTVCERIRDALTGDKPLDLNAVDAILASIPPDGQGNAEFIVGKFLMTRDPEMARKHLQKAFESKYTYDWSHAIARSLLKVESP